jgi:endonuclease YncB( thermonuclease family)
MWDNRSLFIDNHDGDTITYRSDMGRRIYSEAEIRLLGVRAPELSQPGGKETREFVTRWHMDRVRGKRWPFMVTTTVTYIKDPDQSEAKKTLERFLAVVTCIETNENLNVMVQDFVNASGYAPGM